MKNILSEITEQEKNRILEMHRRSTSKHYLTEQPTPETTPTPTGQAVGGGMKVDVGTTLGNGMNIKKFDTRSLDTYRQVFLQIEDNGMGEMFACGRHEQGKYYLSPKGVLTQAESQALYDKFCKSGTNTETTGQAVGGGMKVDVGTTLGNGMNIKKFDTRSLDTYRQVFLQIEDNGMGEMFACGRHEQGKYYLSPKGVLTQAESQALYDKFCKK